MSIAVLNCYQQDKTICQSVCPSVCHLLIGCRCPPGFVGERCEEVYVSFDYVSSEEEVVENKGLVVSFIIFTIVIAIGLVGLCIWR